ncbi:MAG: PqqD family peptide modification chaperone [Pyrinomonadaceae bacterium]|nr:PqqD family peptide modification chaperone [Pyrinomonadaceae bacterium]
MNNKPQSRKTNVVVQEFEKEILIYDLNINKAFCLNHTSALVYELCDGKHSIAEISEKISRKLKTEVSEDFVRLALEELRKNDLLEGSADNISLLAGKNRREMIRKIGLTSMLALPLISSIIAPTAANAQSNVTCLPVGPCLAAGTLLCPPGCTQVLSGFSYTSTNGTCTVQSSGLQTVDCSVLPQGVLSAVDIRLV